MQLPAPLIEGRLLKRYKRFLADVELADGTVVTAHTPNTGSMSQCAVPGYPVLVSANDDPKRKLKYTLELIRVNGHWVDTHTQRTNRIVEEGLLADKIAEFTGYRLQREFRYGDQAIAYKGSDDHLCRTIGGHAWFPRLSARVAASKLNDLLLVDKCKVLRLTGQKVSLRQCQTKMA